MRRWVRPLDRYVMGEFWRIFVPMALGFPLLVFIIDLTDRLDKYLNRHIPPGQLALSYLYWTPESMFMVLPAAVLFATVFSIGSLTRHSEITAAKASGISFHRLIAPVYVAATIVTVFAFWLGELAPVTSAKRNQILDQRQGQVREGQDRFNFAYAAQGGRVYKIAALSMERHAIDNVEIDRPCRDPEAPECASYVLAARVGQWDSTRKFWTLRMGDLHLLPDSTHNLAIAFDSLHDRDFREAPVDLTAQQKKPEEMRFKELGRFIHSLERSGADTNELKVEQSLKIAIPVTCLIIVFFGAPLATSTQRGGAAFGVGVSLATTIIFLILIQLTKAIGQGGVVPPHVAAWLPNALFGLIGLVLLVRTRT